MKKKTILSILFLAISQYGLAQSKIDTIYYDSKWRGCEPAFASFYRIYSIPSDSNFVKRFRDYYITGELQSEGEYMSINRYDDTKSVFDGEYRTYFKSGKIEQMGTLKNGVEDGEYTRYNENGLILIHTHYLNGNLNGIYTEFKDDNICYQAEYDNGKPINNYYTLSNADGCCSKFDLTTNEPIYESPAANSLQTEYKNGEMWLYYNANGLMIGMSNKKVNDYGKYFQIPIVIVNNSLAQIEFDPYNVFADLSDKKGNIKPLKVYLAEEYLKKVKRRQNWATALVALGEGISSAGAGYSTSYSTSYSNGFLSNNYSGFSTTTTTTTTYDAAAAYRARVLANERIASFSKALLAEREVKDKGYLKRTTVYPGETITGYINIERQKGMVLNVTLKICGIDYDFLWDVYKF